MRFAVLSAINRSEMNHPHGGEARAFSCLFKCLKAVGADVVVLGIGTGTGGTTEQGYPIYSADHPEEWDFEADFLLSEFCYIEHSIRREVADAMVTHCNNSLVAFRWILHEPSEHYEPRTKAIVSYTKQEDFDEIKSLLHVPVREWVPFVEEHGEWDRNNTLSNLTVWAGSSNAIAEARQYMVDHALQAWRQAARYCPDWYLDLTRYDHVMTGHPEVRQQDEARARIHETPRVRALPTYSYHPWMTYARRSSAFLCRRYTYTGQGQIEPAYMGVPSILQPHFAVPSDYPYRLDEFDTVEKTAGMIRTFYEHSKRKDPVVQAAVDDLRSHLRHLYSYERSCETLAEILGWLEGVI
jgi:hypothetical protein